MLVCDLCGKQIDNCDIEEYKYKIKKRWHLWDESGWCKIDVHKTCREKLFNTIKEAKEEHK